jgi:probable HAF family extracellular repeat protein
MRVKKRLLLALGAAGFVAGHTGAGAVLGAPAQWTVTDLHPANASYSSTVEVNLAGQAAVTATFGSGTEATTHGFFHDPVSGTTDIGTLGGRNTIVWGMSSAGLVTGESQIENSTNYHAFLYTPGIGMRDLGTGNETESLAKDVDESGSVIGALRPSTDAFLWSQGAGIHDLGPGEMDLFNFSGKVFGDLYGVPGMWDSPVSAFTPFGSEPPPLLGEVSGATIFDEASGTFNGLGSHRAFFWDGLQYRYKEPAGFLYTGATSLNDAGDVLVDAHNINGPTTPFIFYSGEDTPVNGNSLNPSTSPVSTFYGFESIDDLGDIGGTGSVGGSVHAVLITPPRANQIETVRRILVHELASSNPFYEYVRRATKAAGRAAKATSCYELGNLAQSLAIGNGVPFAPAQRQVSRNALSTLRKRAKCPSGHVPAVPVTVPHIFSRKGEKERLSVRVGTGKVTILSQFPPGSRLDILGVRGAKKRTATSVRVRLPRRKQGVLRFTVVARKLLDGKPAPVTTRIA